MSVAARLIEAGWHVLFPVGENNRYDLVAEKDGRFVRVQVKYVTPKNGALEVNCRSSNNWSVLRYSSDDIDILAAYDAELKNVYFIPVAQINHSSFKLRLNAARNNQKKKIHLAEGFLKINF